MDRTEITKLLHSISLAYPRFNLFTADGKVNTYLVEEWHRRIGYKSYAEVDRMYEDYLKADNKSAPTLAYFMGQNPAARKAEAFVDNSVKGWHVKNGELLDEEDREYGNQFEEPYYYNQVGHICRRHEGQEIVVVR